VAWPLIIHKCHEGPGAEEPFLKPIGRSCEDRESTLVDLLDVGDRAMLGIVGGVMEFPRLTCPELLLHRPEDPRLEFGPGDRGVENAGMVGCGGVASDNGERDQIHVRAHDCV